MALFITQCPYCKTSFRTSITQLQSADGMVRCGACVRIFAADDNLVPSADLQTISMPVVSNDDSGQLPLDGPDEPPAPLNHPREPGEEQILTLDLADSLTGRLDPSISTSTSFWELLEKAAPEHESALEPVIDADAEPVEEFPQATPAAEVAARIYAPPQHDPQHDPQQEKPMPTLRATNIDDDFLGDVLHGVSMQHPREHFSAENLAAVHEVATPLEIDWQPPRRSGASTLIMGFLALVLATGLPAQYAWQHRIELSQDQRLRPWLELVCETAGCSLPPLIDLRAISSDELLVRSHTEIANALSITLVFRNNADFAQPFPALELRFTAADNTLVAQRRFLPREYLNEELAGMQMMPPDAPVQIALEILDPGVRAINYEVSFSPVLSQNQPWY